METNPAYLRVGILIAAGVALAIGIVWFLGGERFRHGTVFESYFDESVQGLEVGAPVKYRGVTVGRVTAIGLVSAAYGREAMDLDRRAYRQVFVRYLVDTAKIGPVPPLAKAIALGLRARVVSQVLTGIGYVELDFFNPVAYPAVTPPWKPEAAFIPSVPSTFAQVQDAAQALLAKLDKVDLDRLSRDLVGLVESLQAELANGDVHRTLADADLLLRTTRQQVRAADLPALSAELRHTAAALQALARDPALRRTLANSATASARLVALSAQLQALAARLQVALTQTASGTAALRARIDPILRDLGAAASDLRDTTDTIRRYPASILAAPPPRGDGGG
ncbi:MAG: MCE family protein [Rhodospirillales bacterium]|nr:MCE family protein [Rhodospirillales bacterium]